MRHTCAIIPTRLFTGILIVCGFLLANGCRMKEQPVTTIYNISWPFAQGYINGSFFRLASENPYAGVYLENRAYYDQGEEHAVLGYYFVIDLDSVFFRLNFFHLDTLVYVNQPNLQTDYYFNKDFTEIREIFGVGDWPVLPDTCYNLDDFKQYGIERGVRVFYSDYPQNDGTWHVVADATMSNTPDRRISILRTLLNEIILMGEDGNESADSALYIQGVFDCTFLGGSADTVKMEDIQFGLIYHRLPQDNYIID